VNPANTISIRNDFLGYRPEELIGQGGMGVVYRARDLRLKRIVALKVMAPELAADERFRERFAREAELAMSLEHPNVVPIHDAGELDGRLYLVMRLVEGTDLRALLREQGALEPRRALAIVAQVANALDAAHAKGLVHRDVKPSNVLLDHDEHVYLADFGLTRSFGSTSSTDGPSVGTPAYLAPEQIEGQEIDGRADVYSLGCLLYECLTGAPPFAGSSRLAVAWAHLEEEPPAVTERRGDLAPAIDGVVRKAMAKDPDDRYATCGELATAAEAALGLQRRRQSKLRRALLVVAAVAVVAAAVGLFATRAGGDGAPVEVAHNTIVRVDPKTNRVSAVIEVGKFPGATAAAGDRVWAYSFTDHTVSEIDARTNDVVHTTRVVTVPYLADSEGPVLAADEDGAWVAGYILETGGSVLTRIFRGGEARQYRLRANVVEVVTGGGALWVHGRAPSGNQLIRVDPRTGRVTRRLPLSDAFASAIGLNYGGGQLWLVDEDQGVLFRVDPKTGDTRSVDLGSRVIRPVFGMGYIWLCADTQHGIEMTRVDPRSLRAESAGKGLPAEDEGGEYAAGLGSVWRLDIKSGTLMRFSPKTRDLSGLVHLLDARTQAGRHVTWIAAGDGALWLAVA
jgi:serine/threonine-protein kinase